MNWRKTLWNWWYGTTKQEIRERVRSENYSRLLEIVSEVNPPANTPRFFQVEFAKEEIKRREPEMKYGIVV